MSVFIKLIFSSFLVVWQSRENYYWKAKGQKFNADGTTNGDEFSIIGSSQYESFEELSATGLSNGDYVISFRSNNKIKFQIIKTDSEVNESSQYTEAIVEVGPVFAFTAAPKFTSNTVKGV